MLKVHTLGARTPGLENRARPFARATICVVVLTGAMAGCSSGPGLEETPKLDLAGILKETTEYQREIIADGIVTPEEYERALLERRDCVASSGAAPGPIYKIGNGEQTFDFEITATNDDAMNIIQQKADACLPAFFDDVGAVWAFQNLLSPEERQKMQPLVVECLAERGVKVDSNATSDQIARVVQEVEDFSKVSPCVEEYIAFFSAAPED